MKQTYQKPTVCVIRLTAAQTILAGSVTGGKVYDTEVNNVSGFSRSNRDDWDDED